MLEKPAEALERPWHHAREGLSTSGQNDPSDGCGGFGHLRRNCRQGYHQRHSPEENRPRLERQIEKLEKATGSPLMPPPYAMIIARQDITLDCLRKTHSRRGHCRRHPERLPHIEGSFRKGDSGVAPTDNLDVRRQYHKKVHPGTGCHARPQCIRGFEAPLGYEEVPLQSPRV
jgi:hypothetical protein